MSRNNPYYIVEAIDGRLGGTGLPVWHVMTEHSDVPQGIYKRADLAKCHYDLAVAFYQLRKSKVWKTR